MGKPRINPIINGVESKICNDCKTMKPISEYCKNIKGYDGHKSLCRYCVKIRDDKYLSDPVKRKNKNEAKQKWKLENRSRESDWHKSYKKKNEVKIKEQYSNWVKNNPELHKIYTENRRLKKLSVECNFSIIEWLKCIEYFNNKCAYCGKIVKLSQDHFIPLSKNGSYTINNIIPACKSCNSSKNDSDFFEWYIKQNYYHKKREQKILKYLNYTGKTQQLTLAL